MHYKVMWQLKKSKGLHYGLWYDDTESLHEAIQNTNKKVGSFLNVSNESEVLDAGCGVGGSAIYLAEKYPCRVSGITLSPAQYRQGLEYIKDAGLEDKIDISVQDYSYTNFRDERFDLVFGIESFCHAGEKQDVYKEAFRLLKPGGQLLIIDSIKTDKGKLPENRKTIEWLLHRWAISGLDDAEETTCKLGNTGFEDVNIEDLTARVRKSINIIFKRAFLGLLSIPLYLMLYPTKYHFSRRHPESGWALHACFRKKLIQYVCISARKPVRPDPSKK
ncbi:MAG: class I SAM-dependent methyltransferase [Bacteroidota bacterium]|nr:class I SAM-dependent methyltransferase [Bacteroidota bacterium]